VVDLILLEIDFHVNGGADGDDIREDVSCDAAVDVCAVEPNPVAVANVADDIAAKKHVLRRMELGCCRLPLAFCVGPTAPLQQVVFNEHIARAHTRDAFDTAVTDRVAADDVGLRGLLWTTPSTADLQADGVRPFDSVVLDDPVIAAHNIEHRTPLRQWKSIARVLEIKPLHPDIAEPAVRGCEDLLAGGDLDRMVGGSAVRKADVDRLAVGVGPEPALLRAADLLHDRTAAR